MSTPGFVLSAAQRLKALHKAVEAHAARVEGPADRPRSFAGVVLVQLLRISAYWWAFIACSIAALVPLWTVKYLPMVDLPQHLAQVAIWMHIKDPAWGFGEQYGLNFMSPYLLGYVLIRVAAVFFDLDVAAKLVISVAVLGTPLALHRLLVRCGGDRWWSLVGFLLAFGFGFYWGFLNYILAVPLGLLLLAESHEFRRCPSAKNGAIVAAQWRRAVFQIEHAAPRQSLIFWFDY